MKNDSTAKVIYLSKEREEQNCDRQLDSMIFRLQFQCEKIERNVKHEQLHPGVAVVSAFSSFSRVEMSCGRFSNAKI